MHKYLAWHETLEIHELVAFQANGLIALKRNLHHVKDEHLRLLYEQAITGTEQNLKELLAFYPSAPQVDDPRDERLMEPFFAGNLLVFAKCSVRNYAIAITEAATPQVREALNTHLQRCIELHGKVFYYMYEHSYYPAYNLQQLLANDMNLAHKAMSM